VRRRRLQLAAVVAVLGLMGVVTAAVAGGGGRHVREHLAGYAEVPSVSSTGVGVLRAEVRNTEIRYRLSYRELEGNVTQAHIHFGHEWDAGGISAFLCSNLGNGPAGTPACPGTHTGAVEGTIEPADVVGPKGQGIAPGEYGELLRAIRAGVTYANVHSTEHEGGEIRAQIERGGSDH
jgi:hypothetical protein